jgi:hypothetical protein
MATEPLYNPLHELYQAYSLFYGSDKQIIKAIEEMSELQKALCKCLIDGKQTQNDRKAELIDEIADVSIMLDQVRYLFKIDEQLIYDRIQFKVDRMKLRLEEAREA